MSTKTLQIFYCCCLLLLPCTSSLAREQSQGGPERPLAPAARENRDSHDRHREPGKDRKVPRTPETTAKGHAANASHNALQFGPAGRWWDDRSVVQAIGLRREQQKRMDAIFDANKSAILDNYKTFLKAQNNLASVNKDPQVDKSAVFAAIDAVNEARSALQKATSAMLLQIRKEMDAGQVTKLESVQ